MKISIIIPFVDINTNIERSLDFVFRQKKNCMEYEVVIVNAIHDEEALERLSRLESEKSDSIALVNLEEKAEYADLLNVGIQYCTGDYMVFVRAGDAINIRFFETIGEVADREKPEIISYQMTYVHPHFELYDDDPFGVEEFKVINPGDENGKRSYLMACGISDCYLCHVFKKSFVDEIGIRFSEKDSEEGALFTYPLLLLAEGMAYTGDYGYCRFEDGIKKKVTGKVTERMTEQTALYEMLKGDPDIYNRYKAEIDAHFVREYYLGNLKLARAAGLQDRLKLSTFEVMQYVTHTLVPNWTENDYLFGMNKDDRELMLLLNCQFDSDEELDKTLKEDKLITVITTTYKRCEKIRNSIECILKQSWEYFEYVIVDDGSNDRTEEVVREFDDPRIKFIKNPENRGLCYSRNVGIRNSTGKYIVCQDDDDFCRLNKLEKEIEYFLGASDEYGFVYCETINHVKRLAGVTDEDAVIIPGREVSDVRKSGYIFPALLIRNTITATAAMFTRSSLEAVGMYDEELFGYEDWDIYLRLSKKYLVGFIREPLYDYYQMSGSLISNRDIEHRRKIIKSLYDIDQKFVEDRKLYGIESSFKVVTE
ncbi:glycosyltransferase [Butyrivibrio proteoclasticus]|uniref:glycosyltransferase n=1 Tax=Butyrivibrio proteoclasticus TaxID=43305 RepID=UPI00047A8786|nr:glycosyltransferase [Butyrivibrio proteoclasticus]